MPCLYGTRMQDCKLPHISFVHPYASVCAGRSDPEKDKQYLSSTEALSVVTQHDAGGNKLKRWCKGLNIVA